MSEEVQLLNLVLDNLAKLKMTVDELLRRIPEPRCSYCGLVSSLHGRNFAIEDHDFIA